MTDTAERPNRIKTKLKGKIVAYNVRFRPEFIKELNNGGTFRKAPKIDATLEIEVDDRTHYVSSRASERAAKESNSWPDNGVDPSPQLFKQTFNNMIDMYPNGTELEFMMIEEKGKRRPRRWYELLE